MEDNGGSVESWFKNMVAHSEGSVQQEGEEVVTQDQIILLLDLKASKDRGAASLSCGQLAMLAQGLERLKMIEKHRSFDGYFITKKGEKYLEKRKEKVKVKK